MDRRYRFYQWLIRFFFINAVIASFVFFAYRADIRALSATPFATTTSTFFAKFYLFIAFFSQVSLFMFVAAIITIGIRLLVRSRKITIVCAALLAAIAIFVVIGDAFLYRLYHMHYGGLVWRIVKADAFSEVLPLGIQEWLLIALFIAVLFSLEILLAYRLRNAIKYNKAILTFVATSWAFSYGAFALAVNNKLWSTSNRYAILRSGHIAPYLSQVYLSVFSRHKRKLHYPLKSIDSRTPEKPMNIVIIGIDTWRYEAMSEQYSPNIYQFAQQALQFTQHYSGGNCTQSGLFSLFYGIPSTYWAAVTQQHRRPVLFDTLQAQNYQMGFFLSATPNFPEFNENIFSGLSLNDTTGHTSLERDKNITEEAIQFIKQQNTNQPFFAFLFYDGLHNYCETSDKDTHTFRPYVKRCNHLSLNRDTDPLPYRNRYYNKSIDVDHYVGRVLDALKQQNVLRNTIVILTADHGEQMNDEGKGLWGHASAYNDYQLHVPLIVYWPDRAPEMSNKLTTHYDLIPTLMQDALGVKNPPDDYAVGHSLFSKRPLPYFTAASYGDYALLYLPDVLRFYPAGDYQASTTDLTRFNKVSSELEVFFK